MKRIRTWRGIYKLLSNVWSQTDGLKMKKLLKLYKMFYRLLRLNRVQKQTIECKCAIMFKEIHAKVFKENKEMEELLYRYNNVADMFGCKKPEDFIKLIPFGVRLDELE